MSSGLSAVGPAEAALPDGLVLGKYRMWQSRSHNRLPTRQWRRLRAEILATEPFCRQCIEEGRFNRDTVAVILDHIEPLAEGGTNDRTNLQPLCQPCHDLKTAQESARARGAIEPTMVRVKPTFGLDGWPLP